MSSKKIQFNSKILSIASTRLFLDKMPTKSYDNACRIYISMKNAVNILQRSIKDTRVAIVGGRIPIPIDPDTIGILRSRILMDLLPYCEGGSMIPVDLRQIVSAGSMIRMDPGSRSLGSDPGIRFRDPRTCLHNSLCPLIVARFSEAVMDHFSEDSTPDHSYQAFYFEHIRIYNYRRHSPFRHPSRHSL